MTFSSGCNEMTTAVAYGYFKDRYCGHPLSGLMVILRLRTLLAEEEIISEMILCPEPMTLIVTWYFSVLSEQDLLFLR